jgi:drug/metabolite transporter (DMT)-like permease
MLEYIASIGSLLTFGCMSASSKRNINEIGRHRANAYSYLVLVALLLIGVFVLDVNVDFPKNLIIPYIAEIIVGGLGVIAAYKALDYGKSSITSPLARIYVLIIMATGVVFLGEQLTIGQIIGGTLIVMSAIALALNNGKIQFERWMGYLAVSIICRAYYYMFIKDFVLALGAYQTTLFLETGIMVFVIGFHAVRGKNLSPPSRKESKFVLTSGILFFMGSLLYSISVSSIGAVLTSMITAGSPIINVVTAHFLLGEKLDFVKYLAIVMMVVGLLAILF